MLLIVLSAVNVFSAKPMAIAVCEANQTTGVCATTSPFWKFDMVIQEQNMLETLQNYNVCGDGIKLLTVTQGNTELSNDWITTLDDCDAVGTILIGNIKAAANNATHIQINALQGKSSGAKAEVGCSECGSGACDAAYDCQQCCMNLGCKATPSYHICNNVGHTVTYGATKDVQYSELNVTYDLVNVTMWNGTANVTEETNVSSLNEFFVIEPFEISIDTTTVPTADGDAVLTVVTGLTAPPVVLVDGETCNGNCADMMFNVTTTELGVNVTNFSVYTFSANSNVFAVYQPTASCISNANGVYYGCSGRYGIGVNWTELYAAEYSPLETILNVGWFDHDKVILSGSNEWYVSMQADSDVASYVDGMTNILGRVKGQSHHDSLMNGSYTNGLVIDSAYSTVTYETGVGNSIDMGAVLDMSVDVLVSDDPFNLLNGLIAVDSGSYSTLDKPAHIKFKQVSHSNPRLLRNGVECPGSVCSGVVFDSVAATLEADVTGFSNFSYGGYNATYDGADLQPIVVDGLGTIGAETVDWIDLIIISLVVVFVVGFFVIKIGKFK